MREAVDGRIEQLGIGFGPVVEERGAQSVDRRTGDAEVGVAPVVLVFGVAQPLVRDPDATGETHAFVDDHHLAVRSMVELTEMQTPERAEPAHRDTGFLELREQRSLDGVRAPRVEEHSNTYALRRAIGQRPREQPADLTLPVHEREEVDGVVRAADRVEHRGEDLVAVL